jgi:hypothetical protein
LCQPVEFAVTQPHAATNFPVMFTEKVTKLQSIVRILQRDAPISGEHFSIIQHIQNETRTPFFLLLTTTQVHAARRLAILYSTQFLSPNNQSLCASVLAAASPAGKCFEYAECILAHKSEYAKAGMGSGTAMLGLIPAGIALLPGNGPGVDEVFRRGWWYLFLSVFCGHAGVGVASQALAGRCAGSADDGTELEEGGSVEQGQVGERAVQREKGQKPVFMVVGIPRVLLLLFGTLLVVATIILGVVLGFQTVVTWACNHDLLIAGYLGLRVVPGLLKLTLLVCLPKFIDVRPQMREQSVEALKGVNKAVVLANVVKGFTLTLWAGIWVHGTAVLASSIMLDGS